MEGFLVKYGTQASFQNLSNYTGFASGFLLDCVVFLFIVGQAFDNDQNNVKFNL